MKAAGVACYAGGILGTMSTKSASMARTIIELKASPLIHWQVHWLDSHFSPATRDALEGGAELSGGFKGGCKIGYWRFEKRLGCNGRFNRLEPVGGGQKVG